MPGCNSPEYTGSIENIDLPEPGALSGDSLHLNKDPFSGFSLIKLYGAAGCLHRLQRKFRLPLPAGKVKEAVKDTAKKMFRYTVPFSRVSGVYTGA